MKIIISVLVFFFHKNFLKYKRNVWKESGFKFIGALLLTVWTLKNLSVGSLIFDNIWLAGCDWYFALSQIFYFIHPAPKSILDLMWTCVGRNVIWAGRWKLESTELCYMVFLKGTFFPHVISQECRFFFSLRGGMMSLANYRVFLRTFLANFLLPLHLSHKMMHLRDWKGKYHSCFFPE